MSNERMFSNIGLGVHDSIASLTALAAAGTFQEYLVALINCSVLEELQLSCLSGELLLRLGEQFRQAEFNQLTLAICFFRLAPEKLFTTRASAEKLMSVKMRLMHLYHFIAIFQTDLAAILRKKNIYLVDNLLHHEVLPAGVEIALTADERELIIHALGNYHLCGKRQDDIAENYVNFMQNVRRSYKFWFNPSQLIDSIMLLSQHLGGCEEDFAARIRSFYHNFSTADCLWLYGYFANKDTCYLMRSLLTLQKHCSTDWINLNTTNLLTLGRVIKILELVMEGVRIELQERKLATYGYNRTVLQELCPGKRNREAIMRMLALYDTFDSGTNQRILELFDELHYHLSASSG